MNAGAAIVTPPGSVGSTAFSVIVWLFLFRVVTVIFAVPAFNAVTTPVLLPTDSTFGALLVQVRPDTGSRSSTEGTSAASSVSVRFSPSFRYSVVNAGAAIVTPPGSVASITLSVIVWLFLFRVVTVIFAVPTLFGVTSPVALSTASTFASLVVQVNGDSGM